MDSCGQKPFFCVVLRDGDRWLVEAEWPDGTIVEVDSFKAHLDALNWVKTQSQAWLQGRGDTTSGEYRAIADEADVPLFVEHCEAVAAEIDVKLRWLGEQARRGLSVWSDALAVRHVMPEVACEPSVVGSL